jgi:hypothetical protein
VAPNPFRSDSNVDQVDSKIIAHNDISNNGSQLIRDSEEAIQQADSASEGAPHDTIVPINHSTETNIAPEVPVRNEHSETGQPRRNVGNYKQGPAKIRRLPIVGEEYDFSFSAISEWDQPVPVIANRVNVQTKYHPQQRLQKSFLAECYLLQDCWTDNPDCIHQIYSNIILGSWESDDIYLTDIQDPRLLAAHSSASKYNEDNPSWEIAMKGPF